MALSPNLTLSVFSLVTVVASNPSLVLIFHTRYVVSDTVVLYRLLTGIILSSATEAVVGDRKRITLVVFLSGTICIEDFAGKIWVTPSSRAQRRMARVWFNLAKTLGEVLK